MLDFLGLWIVVAMKLDICDVHIMDLVLIEKMNIECCLYCATMVPI